MNMVPVAKGRCISAPFFLPYFLNYYSLELTFKLNARSV